MASTWCCTLVTDLRGLDTIFRLAHIKTWVCTVGSNTGNKGRNSCLSSRLLLVGLIVFPSSFANLLRSQSHVLESWTVIFHPSCGENLHSPQGAQRFPLVSAISHIFAMTVSPISSQEMPIPGQRWAIAFRGAPSHWVMWFHRDQCPSTCLE